MILHDTYLKKHLKVTSLIISPVRGRPSCPPCALTCTRTFIVPSLCPHLYEDVHRALLVPSPVRGRSSCPPCALTCTRTFIVPSLCPHLYEDVHRALLVPSPVRGRSSCPPCALTCTRTFIVPSLCPHLYEDVHRVLLVPSPVRGRSSYPPCALTCTRTFVVPSLCPHLYEDVHRALLVPSPVRGCSSCLPCSSPALLRSSCRSGCVRDRGRRRGWGGSRGGACRAWRGRALPTAGGTSWESVQTGRPTRTPPRPCHPSQSPANDLAPRQPIPNLQQGRLQKTPSTVITSVVLMPNYELKKVTCFRWLRCLSSK